MGAKEEKLKDIQEAAKLYKQANELVAKANELITRNVRGLELIENKQKVCNYTDYEAYRGKFVVHVFKGIMKLAKVLDADTYPERDWFGRENKSRKVVLTDDVMFFQIGEPTQSRYCYK